MEPFLVLLGLAALAWILLGPILIIVLWSRVRQVEENLQRLRRTRPARGEAPAPEARPVPPDRREPKPELPRPAPIAEEPVVWIEESTEPAPPRAGAPRPVSAAAEPAGIRPKIPAPSQPAEVFAESLGPAEKPEAGESFSLEELLAGKWMTWVGALAVVIGAGFALKYAIDNDYLGPTGRVVLGLVTGMVCFAGGALAIQRNYRFLGQGLVGAALGILYLSLYFAYDYKLIPKDAAFLGMIAVTASGLAFSTVFNAQPTAILGLLGGFLSPIMLSSGADERWILFPYLTVLDLGVLGIAGFRKWQPLQVLAFVATVFMWLGWFGQHYAPEKFTDVCLLLTPFFLLFALLGVFHNVLRRKPATPGDFILILATPVAYFGALYYITNRDYADWQGLLAIVLAAVYLAFALLAMQRHPAGKTTVVALAGIAASFLTIAVPLQLTGHWVAIAWAAEAVLLVELGLRFEQMKLRLAGFGLLGVVQVILVFYSVQTFDNPAAFQTRFTHRTRDVVVQGSLPTLPEAQTAPPGTPQPPSWTSVFNGRSFSFLASATALGILAWEFRRRRTSGDIVPTGAAGKAPPLPDNEVFGAIPPAALLIAAIPLTLMTLLIVETFAFGHSRRWLFPTYVGLFEVWTALAALGLMAFGALLGPRSLQKVAVGIFGILAIFLFVSLTGTLAGWSREWNQLLSGDPAAADSIWTWTLFNPRGIGFLAALGAAAAAALLYRRDEELEPGAGGEPARRPGAGLGLGAALGVFAHLTGLALITSEVYAQGIIRQWHTGTSLAVTAAWTLYAAGTLGAGIYWRSATVRILALGLFGFATAKVFLFDVWQLEKEIRYIAFVGLGASLLLVSFLYRRFRDRIRAWIKPASILIVATLLWGPSPADAAGDRSPPNPVSRLTDRWPIEVDAKLAATMGPTRGPGRAMVRVLLPADLYAIARLDLGDLRIFSTSTSADSPIEVPYLMLQSRDSRTMTERAAPLLDLSEVAGKTQFLLEVGKTVEPVNSLTIQIDDSDRNYVRTVTIWGANRRDAPVWNLLSRDGYLLDKTQPGHRLTVGNINFPQNRFPCYKVEINNLGEPPLHVARAKLFLRVEKRAERREFETQIVSQRHDPAKKRTHVIFDVSYRRLPSVGLVLDVDFDGHYFRPVTLETTDELLEKPLWRTVAAGQIYRIDRDGTTTDVREVDYAEAAGRYLRLTIDNGDDRPLNVRKGTVLSIDRSLACEARYFVAEGRTAALYAGNARLEAPTYDLGRTVGVAALESSPLLTLGAREPNPLFTGRPDPGLPWSERHRPLMWSLVVVGIIVLGSATILVLKQAAKNPGGQ
ncbi:MAG: DUF2339 domain-containing protein [Deltaproteobacteria bacterium]